VVKLIITDRLLDAFGALHKDEFAQPAQPVAGLLRSTGRSR
jgi:hypothetical protein